MDPSCIVWLGLRDVDAGEANRIAGIDGRNAISMHEVDRYGVGPMIEQAVARLKQAGARRLWVSFDADVLDPQIAPGTGTKVRGGLTYREAHLLAEILHETLRSDDPPFQLVGVKIAEVNPILDQQNATASLCVEWVSSLFGKRILPQWD
jgi:arginase